MDADAPKGSTVPEVGPALADWLDKVAGLSGPFTLSPFAGGQSNPTFRLDTGEGTYVLRKKPEGDLMRSAHAVEREYRVIGALATTGFPVPRAIALCEDVSIFGSTFYVMEHVHGRSLWNLALPELAPFERRALYFDQADTLARLHTIDPASAGLADYGKGGSYFERQLARWSSQYGKTKTSEIPAMEALIARLPATMPARGRTAIVHGDFRLDNMIIDRTAPRVAAVLDWELSTLGDPLADFSYYLLSWIMPPDQRASLRVVPDLEASGIPSLEEMIARYAEKSGLPAVGPLDWYFAFNFFRLAAIVQGVYDRALKGTAAGADALAHGARVEPLAIAGLSCLDKAERG